MRDVPVTAPDPIRARPDELAAHPHSDGAMWTGQHGYCTPPVSLAAELDRLDGFLTAATQGPWQTASYDDGADITPTGQSDVLIAINAREADAALIVAAVNAVPRLLAAVRAVTDLAEQRDAAVRSSVPASAAERIITDGVHTVQVGDLRRALAAALGEPR